MSPTHRVHFVQVLYEGYALDLSNARFPVPFFHQILDDMDEATTSSPRHSATPSTSSKSSAAAKPAVKLTMVDLLSEEIEPRLSVVENVANLVLISMVSEFRSIKCNKLVAVRALPHTAKPAYCGGECCKVFKTKYRTATNLDLEPELMKNIWLKFVSAASTIPSKDDKC